MARLRPVSRDEAGPEVREIYRAVFGDRDPVAEPGTDTGSPGDWWTVMALVPDLLANLSAQFGAFNSKQRELPAPLRELAILRAGFVTGCQFVFSQHSKVARAVGVRPEEVAAVPAWPASTELGAEQRAVLAYVDELVLQDGRVQDPTFEALRGFLSDAAILELTIVAATYHLHAIVSRALRLEFDDVAERVVEVPAPAGFREEDLLALLAGE
jgi:AhpD family alkylhydroperoxidase